MAGRICMIKSVLNSLPLYFISIFLMPKGVCRLLTSIQRRFARFNGAQLSEKSLVEVQVSDPYSKRIKLCYSNGFGDQARNVKVNGAI
jgi:hypothetical protein